MSSPPVAPETVTGVERLFAELEAKIREFRPKDDLSAVEKAYRFASDHHSRQKRDSGEPYMNHPLYVSDTLADPGLSFEEHTVLFPHSFIEKQHHVVQQKTAALEAAQQRAQGLDFTRQALHDGLVAGKQTVSTSVEASLGAGAGLQGMVETARATVGSDVQNLGVEIDQTHTAHGREVEGLRRDVDGHQANFSDRLDQLRNALRTDTDRMLENARDRIEDLSSTLSRAMSDLKDGVHELDDQLKEASEEAAEGRQSLAPPFEEMENLLRPLKQAIENVREAAANVGIAF